MVEIHRCGGIVAASPMLRNGLSPAGKSCKGESRFFFLHFWTLPEGSCHESDNTSRKSGKMAFRYQTQIRRWGVYKKGLKKGIRD